MQETHEKMLKKVMIRLDFLKQIAHVIKNIKSKINKDQLAAAYLDAEPKIIKILSDNQCPIDNRYYQILKNVKRFNFVKMIEKTQKDIKEYYQLPIKDSKLEEDIERVELVQSPKIRKTKKIRKLKKEELQKIKLQEKIYEESINIADDFMI